jgi:hypothetical protein
MARSIANQQVLLAPETTPGTAVTTGFNKLSAIKMRPGWDGAKEPFMASGSKVANTVMDVDEISNWSVDQAQCFNHQGYVAASRIGLPTTTTPGGGTDSRQHVFALNPDGVDSFRSYTALFGDPWEAFRGVYGAFNSMGMDIQRGRLSFSSSFISRAVEPGYDLPTNEVQTLTKNGTPTTGNFTLQFPFAPGSPTTANIALAATASDVKTAITTLSVFDVDDVDVTGGPIGSAPFVVTFKGRYGQRDLALMVAADTFDDGGVTVAEQTPGAAPTTVAAVPIPSIMWDIWADDSWATLGTTQLLAAYQGNLSLGDKFAPDAPINSSIVSYESLLEAESQDQTFELRVGVDAVAVSLINTFKSGALKMFRMKVEGPTIESTIKYSAQVDFAAFILSRGEISAAPNSPAVSIPLTCALAKDPTSGKALELTLVNTVTAY